MSTLKIDDKEINVNDYFIDDEDLFLEEINLSFNKISKDKNFKEDEFENLIQSIEANEYENLFY